MYTKFDRTENDIYVLKQQGKISIYIIGIPLLALSLLFFKTYLSNPVDKSNLLLGSFMLLFSLLIFRKLTRRFKVLVKEQVVQSTSGFGAGVKEYKFQDFTGFTAETARGMVTLGNSLKLDFEVNGKYKTIVLGQNISVKNNRVITEELSRLMNLSTDE